MTDRKMDPKTVISWHLEPAATVTMRESTVMTSVRWEGEDGLVLIEGKRFGSHRSAGEGQEQSLTEPTDTMDRLQP